MTPKTVERERDLADQLRAHYEHAKEEWRDIYKDLAVKGATAIFGGEGIARVVDSALIPISVGAAAWSYRTWSGPVEF